MVYLFKIEAKPTMLKYSSFYRFDVIIILLAFKSFLPNVHMQVHSGTPFSSTFLLAITPALSGKYAVEFTGRRIVPHTTGNQDFKALLHYLQLVLQLDRNG